MVEKINGLWLICSLAFLGGAMCGGLLYRMFMPATARSNKLAAQLATLQQEFTRYQTTVADHFTTTAHLVNNLTHAHQDVHSHLANGALALCNDETVSHQLHDTLLGSHALLSETRTQPPPEPCPSAGQPKDYAPKQRPDEQGTLAEGFGLATKS